MAVGQYSHAEEVDDDAGRDKVKDVKEFGIASFGRVSSCFQECLASSGREPLHWKRAILGRAGVLVGIAMQANPPVSSPISTIHSGYLGSG